MNKEKRILEKKVRFLRQKISEIHDFYRELFEIQEFYRGSSDQISLLIDEIDNYNAHLIRIELKEKYELIENEID